MLQGRQSRRSLNYKDILHLEWIECGAAYGGRAITRSRRCRLSRLSHHGHPDNQEFKNNTCNNTQQCYFSSYPKPFSCLYLILPLHNIYFTDAPSFFLIIFPSESGFHISLYAYYTMGTIDII